VHEVLLCVVGTFHCLGLVHALFFCLCSAFETLVDDDALMMHLAMQIESEEAEVFWFVLSIFNAAGGRGSTIVPAAGWQGLVCWLIII